MITIIVTTIIKKQIIITIIITTIIKIQITMIMITIITAKRIKSGDKYQRI